MVGPSSEVVGYFHTKGHYVPKDTNPADFLIDVINDDKDRLVRAWESDSHAKPSTATSSNYRRKTPGFFIQTWLFFRRSILQQFRDIRGFYIDNLLVFVAGSVLGKKIITR